MLHIAYLRHRNMFFPALSQRTFINFPPSWHEVKSSVAVEIGLVHSQYSRRAISTFSVLWNAADKCRILTGQSGRKHSSAHVAFTSVLDLLGWPVGSSYVSVRPFSNSVHHFAMFHPLRHHRTRLVSYQLISVGATIWESHYFVRVNIADTWLGNNGKRGYL